jgi:hypothetical protein
MKEIAMIPKTAGIARLGERLLSVLVFNFGNYPIMAILAIVGIFFEVL